ncbi:C39 family peptidase [Streptomyces hygroscopicus]|uniref:C39 family peptidase n=1 Tax=Streptomyces hygroscopicus TaxID=1912 RepID=UPI0022401021|nr:C39 family peptidase [Streptomyces hygroscopicus]
MLTQAAPASAANRTLSVPFYHQQLSDDCEASALRMVLAYRSHHLTDWQILNEIHVDRLHPHAGYSGPTSGDPYIAFVGDPNGGEISNTGFGVYYPRIAAVARHNGLRVLADGQGITPLRLYKAVANGNPVIVWADYLWRAKRATYYYAFDGRRIPYAGPAEHAVVITGVTPNGVWINDPARGRYWKSKSSFEAGYSTYGHMAVIVS